MSISPHLESEAHRRLADRRGNGASDGSLGTIAVDLDCTVADYPAALRRHLLRTHRPDPDTLPMPPTRYDLSEWDLDRFGGFAAVHSDAVAQRMLLDLRPYDGAIDALWRLSDDGARIKIVTARFVRAGQHHWVARDTTEWADNVGVPYQALCFEDQKTDVWADVYIDDSPANIIALQDTYGYDRVIVYDHPWNRHVDGHRVDNWTDAEATLRALLARQRATV